MSETTKAAGRQTKAPKSGKGAVLTTRITAETRTALEVEAERTGRSISQVAEMWIERGRDTQSLIYRLFGGAQATSALMQIGSRIGEIEAEFGPKFDPAKIAQTYEEAREILDRSYLRRLEIFARSYFASDDKLSEAEVDERARQMVAEYREAARKRSGIGGAHPAVIQRKADGK